MNRMYWNKLMCGERIRPAKTKAVTNDLRTEFEKDYHRILSSASFRRLQDKTQVFPLDKSDFIRTRLTHSLEVSSFAKSLGQNVGNAIIKKNLDEDFTIQTKIDICDVLQCAGLLHDIGNPPFGHFGESAIQDWFKNNLSKIEYSGMALSDILSEQMQQDLYHFEGNTQAFRVVSKLHFLVDENGMNLTKALLGTIMKYPGSSLEIEYDKNNPERDIKRKKMGYFYADRDIYNDVQTSNGTNGCRHPLAFLLEAADDIAYNTADIEDAVKKGCLSYGDLIRELKNEKDTISINSFISKDDNDASNEEKFKLLEELIARLEYLYEKALDKGYEYPELYAVQNWIVSVQGKLLAGASEGFINNYEAIMTGDYKKELFSGTSCEILIDKLGDIAYRYAFISRPILKLEVAADEILTFLLDKFVKAFLYYDTNLAKEKMTSLDEKIVMLMSSNYKRIYHYYSENANDIEKLYLRLLMVTDYVSGMTDSYAKNLYQEYRGID